jgi:hypothetical protein
MGEFGISSEGTSGRRRGPPAALVAGGAVLALLSLVLIGAMAITPYRYADAVRDAARAGDHRRMEELVDFSKVRGGLRREFKAALIAQVRAHGADEDYEGGGFEELAGRPVDPFIDAMIDEVASPAGLEALLTDKPAWVHVSGRASDPVGAAFPKDAQGRRFRAEKRYLAFDRFRYTLINDERKSRVEIDLRRQGLFGWRAVRVTPHMDVEDFVGADVQEAPVAAATAPPAAAPAGEQVTRLSGEVDAAHAEAFLSKVADHVDGIVGVQVWIEPSEGSDATYQVGQDDDRLVISNETYELLAPQSAWRWEHGRYVIDGFFLVKSGGVHQGVSSVALEAVSESAVRLKPNLTVVDSGF